MRDGPGLGAQVFLDLIVVEGCWHVGEGAGGGQRVLTLSTGRAGARQRIVHMSTAWAASVQCAVPPSPARQGLSLQAFR